ncbi:MAG TPA: protein kinase, partial [Gemmatimonadaceae bacterium]|nr:protein kinase [Gemmatimonadaceae bacterium]
AHEHGVIHRDVKPENILLERGRAVVADFGIARAVSAAGSERITGTGLSLGTPAYMSPEQASGERDVDGRADVYSLGCVLYEMLAGEPPFTGPTPQAVVAKRFAGPAPDVGILRDGTPPHVRGALARALARSPADRFPDAADFARALDPSASRPASTGAPGTRTASDGVHLGRLVGRRYVLPIAALGAAGLLVAAGALVLHWRARRAPTATVTAVPAGPTRLAVLPFENLGDTSTAYFADGISDEIRGKLAALSQVLVIARSSSALYRQSRKSVPAITRELGVQYILTATVQWVKDPKGTSRVQVRPELVRVVGNTPLTQWQQSFDAVVTDVFQVQSQIATRVAQALDLQFGAEQRSKLAQQPTTNISAYDAFLRGEETWTTATASTAASTFLVPAAKYFERAVEIDPGFVIAWARLAQTQAVIFGNRPSEARRAGISAAVVRRAAERASALARGGPEGRLALGYYYGLVEKDDERALEEFTLGIRAAPNNSDLLEAASLAEQTLGRWADALAHLRQAALVDPRSASVTVALGHVLLQTRRNEEAQEMFARARSFRPSDVNAVDGLVLAAVARGDIAAAHAAMQIPATLNESTALATVLASRGLGWALDDRLRRVLEKLGPDAFGGDRISWGLALAEAARLRGDEVAVRAYTDSARTAADAALERAPNDPYVHASRGVALARLGRREPAIREGTRAVQLMPTERYAADGPYLQHELVRIYILADEYDKAIDQLESLLETPYYLSPGWLRIDPTFAPLRGNPRFERLARRE